MKIFLLALIATLFFGCGVTTPQFDGDEKFIVVEIERYNDTLVLYKSNFNSNDLFCLSIPAIVAHKGLYNIGDTIFIKK